MRIDRLDLTAFGIFTDKSLDLSANTLHVIHGPNAAGKSTARAAVSNLLFGFGRLSSYAFVHPLNKLQVGARIAGTDKVIEVIRYKRDRDDLIDSKSQLPISPGEWSAYLQGVGQVDFDRIYTLGWEELLHGTAALVAGGGALGESLFYSGLGIQDLHKVLDGIESEAGRLFAPRAKKLTVNAALTAAEAARKDASKLSIRPTHYDSTRREHDKVVAKRQELAAQRINLDQDVERLTTLRGALPQLRDRSQKVHERAEILSAGPVPPATWAARVESALTARSDATRERSEALSRGESASEKLVALEPDPKALAIADDVTSLGEAIKGYVEGLSDQSGLEQGRTEAERAALEVLKAIVGGSPVVVDLDIALPIVGNRKALVPAREDWTAKESKLTLAHATVSSTEEEVAEVTASLAELPVAVDVKPLKSAFDVISRRGNLDATLTTSQTAHAKARAAVLETAGELGLAENEVSGFLSRPLPSDTEVEGILEQVDGHLADTKAADDRVADADTRIGELERSLSSLALESDLPSEEELAGCRDRRNGLWNVIRSSWLEDHTVEPEDDYVDEPTLAVAFEHSMENADETADRLWRDADRTAARSNLLANLEREQGVRAAAQTAAAESRDGAIAAYRDWTAAWPDQPLPTVHTSLRTWSRSVVELKKRNATWTEAKLTHREAFRAVRDARGQLVRLLAACGVPAGLVGRDLASVIDEAKAYLDSIELMESDRSKLEHSKATLLRRLPKQTKAVQVAEDAEKAAAAAFQSLSAPYGIGITASIEAGVLLGQLEDLDQHLTFRAERQGRIDGIDRRSARFESESERLVKAVGGPAVEDHTAAARSLVQRVSLAAEMEAARQPLLASEALARSEVEAADATLSGIEDELQLLATEQNVIDLDALGGLAERASRIAQLDEDIAACEELLIQQGGGRSIDTLEQDAQGLDFSQIDAEITRCQEARSALTTAESKAESEERELDRQLREMDGSDKAALRFADAQLEMSKAQEGAARFVRLILARYLANEAVWRYAEAHQDPVLKCASAYLTTLTDGAYVKAGVTEDSKKTTLLSAITAEFEERQVHELSGGERDALYLSLRLAALEAAIERTGPLPIILDDVLVNLDEDHSSAALRCFAGIASNSQVLLFTHHAHIVALAEQVLASDELTVHRLAPASFR